MSSLVLPLTGARKDVLGALGLDDDGSLTFEIGRPETGATCALVDEAGRLLVHLPLLRAPWSARDLVPTLVDAGLQPDALALWDRAHGDACRESARAYAAEGLPVPAHMARADLDRLHETLLALAARPEAAGPILALDRKDGSASRAFVVLRGPAWVPPVDALLVHDRIFAHHARDFVEVDPADLALEDGEPFADARVVTPVELLDAESLA